MNKLNKIFYIFLLTLVINIFSINLTYASPSTWAQTEVDGAIKLGLVPTNLQSNYQTNIKRSEFCSLAVKMFEAYSKKSMDQILKDNKVNDYNNPFKEKNLSNDVISCYKLGIVSGDDLGYFRPNDNITRQESAKILYMLAHIFGTLEEKSLIDFEDRDKIQNWAIPYVDYVVLTSIMNGVKDGTHIYFQPKAGYTREMAILTIYRLFNNVAIYDKELIGDINTFTLDNAEGLSSTLKLYNYEYKDLSLEKYNSVNVKISSNDYEFKLEITDYKDRTATLNVLGKYASLSSIELDGDPKENELMLKYYDKQDKEYVKLLKYQGDHFDELLTLINIEYFGNEIKADGNGRVYGVFHTFNDGTVNGYYDIRQDYKVERIINESIEGKAVIKQEMQGAIVIFNGRENIVDKDFKNKYKLNIGDSVTIKNLYKEKNLVSIVTETGDEMRVFVTK